MSRYIKVLNEEGTFTEKKVYLDEDMDSFAEWCRINWWYNATLGKWYGHDTPKIKNYKTTAQLRKMWEEWKLAQQRCNGGCCDNGTGYCMFCEKKLI